MKLLMALAMAAGMALAQGPKDEEQLKQLEKDWVGAQKAKDPARLGEILAPEWVGIDWDGKTTDRATALAHLKQAGYSLESIEMGPMTVRFFGITAIVTGSDTEKGTEAGKDASGKYVWTDVFVRKDGKWLAVASQTTKVPK